ncbi:SAF domain-containing protein [Archangium lansingense]|uniref:SAF domain-containing protein n=1 Tax=Archangium lansingense TaxID=2995310 RepID=UPI003B7E5549
MSAPRKPLHKGMLAGGIAVGLGVGLVASGFGAGVLAYTLVKKAERESRAGWILVPVIVAKRDVAPVEALKLDDLAQRSIPEQLVTSSLVRPDSSAYVIGQSLTVPVQEGEPLRWAFFPVATEDLKPEETLLSKECERALDLQPDRPKPDQTAGKIRERIVGGGSP